jgi:hypothetical protein
MFSDMYKVWLGDGLFFLSPHIPLVSSLSFIIRPLSFSSIIVDREIVIPIIMPPIRSPKGNSLDDNDKGKGKATAPRTRKPPVSFCPYVTFKIIY